MYLLIDHKDPKEIRVASLDAHGKLDSLSIEMAIKKQIKGNIYLARIVHVEKALGAAFLDFGEDKNGFLPFRELEKLLPNHKINDRLVGKTLLVQVVKEVRQQKGAALTTNLSLAGRYCILLLHNEDLESSVSRKIKSQAERKRLKEIVSKIRIPENMNLIIRTAGENQTVTDIKRDIKYLLRLRHEIKEKTSKSKAPCLVYEEGNVLKKAIRDLYTKDIKKILIQGKSAYQKTKHFMRSFIPSHAHKVKEYTEREPLFSKFNVDPQIEELLKPEIALPSGGNIVIHPTEALVAIDINSSTSTQEEDSEATAFNTNKEACYEIAKQIKLRELSGIFVVDFIDMDKEENKQKIQQILKTELKKDKAKINVGKISNFSIIEFTRQRMKPNISEYFMETCPYCSSYGSIRTKESMASYIIHSIEKLAFKEHVDAIAITTSPEIANFILNNYRKNLTSIEEKYKVKIMILSDINLPISQYKTDISQTTVQNQDPVKKKKRHISEA